MIKVIAPTPDDDDRYFWEGVAQHKLLLQQCSDCSAIRQPPSPMCSECSSLEWHTLEASGRARVYSWIASRHPTEPDLAPRIVVLLDLEEGVRLVSNLVDMELEDVHYGLEVECVFRNYDGVELVQFRPADRGAESGGKE
jgi:uncharacterized OB-fold protein